MGLHNHHRPGDFHDDLARAGGGRAADSLSTNSPAPMMGRIAHPARCFHAVPLVVQAPEIFP